MLNGFKALTALLVTGSVLIAMPCGAVDDTVEKRIEKPVEQAISIRRNVQQGEEQWREEKAKKIALYNRLQQEQQELEERHTLLQEEHQDLQAKVTAKTQELERIDQIKAQIRPFLQEVLARLQGFYQDDLPFLHAEREQRLKRLQEIIDDPDIALNEKLRKELEALMVEADYGRTIEVTQETIDLEGQPTLVNVFRFGRVALYFRTLDERTCGFFNIAENSWQPLSASYDHAIQTVLEIGAKRRPVEIVSLPLGRLELQ